MRTTSTSIEIAAPAETVWRVLTDFAAYPAWNPFIHRVEGAAEPGARLRVRLGPPGRRPMTFRPRVLAAEPARRLSWLGRLGVPGLVDGEHTFELVSTGSRSCRFVQSEVFRGVLVPFTGTMLAATTAGFGAMNDALRLRAETMAAGLPS